MPPRRRTICLNFKNLLVYLTIFKIWRKRCVEIRDRRGTASQDKNNELNSMYSIYSRAALNNANPGRNGGDSGLERPRGIERFPFFQEHPRLLDLARAARYVTLPPKTTLFREGESCTGCCFVLEGTIRVQKIAESGREIVLYRVGPGETCGLTVAALSSGEDHSADALTETTTSVIVISAERFHVAFENCDDFRSFVLKEQASRMREMIQLIEGVAFDRIDVRLAKCLLMLQDADGFADATHVGLAAELGTAREVISRQLKEFERRQWVELHRKKTLILDTAALRELAGKAGRDSPKTGNPVTPSRGLNGSMARGTGVCHTGSARMPGKNRQHQRLT